MDLQKNLNDTAEFTKETIKTLKQKFDELDRHQKILICHAIGVPILLCLCFFLGRLVQKKKDKKKMNLLLGKMKAEK